MIKKIVVISFSFTRGGAAIAANKFKSICESFTDFDVAGISQDRANYFQLIKRLFSYVLIKLQEDRNPIKHSLNLFSYSPVLKSFKQDPKILHHLNWVNNDTLSVFDFNMIPSGSIITLHDEWLYCGAEHVYKVDDSTLDFKDGYQLRKNGVWGVHLNYWLWKLKIIKLRSRNDLIFTVPSNWLKQRAESSMILKGKDIRILPNSIDTSIFSLSSKGDVNQFRAQNGFSAEDFLFCFGAIRGKNNLLKGAHLLDEAMKVLSEELSGFERKRIKLVDFGGDKITGERLYGFQTVSLGHVACTKDLAILYSSVDCLVLPSLVESFGQIAAESLACETPVVSFDTSGLKDIVLDGKTGLVAQSFCPSSLSDQMLRFFRMSREQRNKLGLNGRSHIVENYSTEVVAKQYRQVINDAFDIKHRVM